jgi:uncharacterized protein
MRMCVGCRRSVPATELLRVVAAPRSDIQPPGTVSVLPDPQRRAAGRGAWIHPDPGCVAQAARRKAFGRGLRVSGPTDLTPLQRYIEEQDTPVAPAAGADATK